ncbi:hypothetical protein LCGC14_1800080 [marine sediment metagenome]|uniref:Endonuclease/exonuclease/phosphatase domain-containing protein n=1 Tax=marine sediment metagenome TaxID=412755 RepID=A0A0F9JPJ8_9ZZZZ
MYKILGKICRIEKINQKQYCRNHNILEILGHEFQDQYKILSKAIHYWTDVHRTLNPTDWGVTYPGKYHSRIDFIYVNQLISSYIINSTTGDTIHAMTGSDHLTVDVFINLN